MTPEQIACARAKFHIENARNMLLRLEEARITIQKHENNVYILLARESNNALLNSLEQKHTTLNDTLEDAHREYTEYMNALGTTESEELKHKAIIASQCIMSTEREIEEVSLEKKIVRLALDEYLMETIIQDGVIVEDYSAYANVLNSVIRDSLVKMNKIVKDNGLSLKMFSTRPIPEYPEYFDI